MVRFPTSTTARLNPRRKESLISDYYDALDFGSPFDALDFGSPFDAALEAFRFDFKRPLATEARWRDSTGKNVDLDAIDREYALNILCMVLVRRGRMGYQPSDMREDALVQKLREVVLTGREPDARDRKRAKAYNGRNRRRGLPWRAPVR